MWIEFDPLPRLAIVVLIGVTVVGAGMALAQETPSVTPPASAGDPSTYWTPERMRRARPLMPTVPGQPAPAPDATRPTPAGPPQGAASGKPSIQTDDSTGGYTQGVPKLPD